MNPISTLLAQPWGRFLMCAAIGVVAGASVAQEATKEPEYKLTLGQYNFSDSGGGLDINLRRSSDWGTTWLGYFKSSGLNADQFRAGLERTFGDTVRVLPSLQIASGGFVGGSVNFETGQTWFAGVGFGRTNQQPYFNLNFDPNDSYSLTGGYRESGGASYTLSYTRDNRDNPDQQHLHAIYRLPLGDGHRFTLDVLFKQGLVNGDAIAKTGATLTYDWPRCFVRLAYDPNTNFSSDNVTRLSVGTRF